MSRRPADFRTIALYLLAGWTTGAIVGLAGGIYLVIMNPVVGIKARLALVLITVFIYSLLLAIPIALLLGSVEFLRPLSQKINQRLGHTFGRFVGLGLMAVGILVLLRSIYELFDGMSSGIPLTLSLYRTFAYIATASILFVIAWLINAIWSLGVGRIGTRKTAFLAISATLASILLVSALFGPKPHRAESSDSGTSYEPTDQAVAYGSNRRVALIGFDGLDPHILDAFLAAGHLPNFSDLRERGMYSQFETLPGGLSPPIWTTIATGVSPTEHGIYDFFTRNLSMTGLDLAAVTNYPVGIGVTTVLKYLGRTRFVKEKVITPSDRDAPAIWTISSLGGVSTCIVDWMGSWPSEPVLGTLVSDRAYFAWNLGTLFLAPEEGTASEHVPLRLSLPDTAPSESLEIAGLCSPEPDCLSSLPPARSGRRIAPGESADFHLSENSFYLEISKRLLSENDCNLFVYYSHLPDFLNHRLSVDELENVLRGEISTETEQLVHEVYKEVDRTLGELLSLLSTEASVLVVSDHGIEIVEDHGQRAVSHGKGPPGIFFFRPSAQRIAGNQAIQEVPSVYDVAPTILTLLGLPITSQMKKSGSVLSDVLMAEFEEPRTVRVIETAKVRLDIEAEAGSNTEIENEMKERLRSLGYIQ